MLSWLGGEFKNGFVTGAFSQAFNGESHIIKKGVRYLHAEPRTYDGEWEEIYNESARVKTKALTIFGKEISISIGVKNYRKTTFEQPRKQAYEFNMTELGFPFPGNKPAVPNVFIDVGDSYPVGSITSACVTVFGFCAYGGPD